MGHAQHKQNGGTAAAVSSPRDEESSSSSSPSSSEPCHNGVNGVAKVVEGDGKGTTSGSSWSSAKTTKANSKLISLLTTQQK